jgi:probable HAF family extracellular repeat protein
MRYITCAFILTAAVAGCSPDAEVTQPEVQFAKVASAPLYEVEILESFAPGFSQGAGINNDGWVSGFTSMSDGTRQAAVWREGLVTPLGTLGGLHSMAVWPGINNSGMIVGISRTDTTETLGESWSCSAFLPGAGKTCLGFFWENDVMTSLATLGGPNGFAAGVNNLGQVVGWAENLVEDDTCNDPQVLQFRAVLWEPKKGTKQELPPYPGDSTSAATAINARGQVVGISGDCDVAVGRKSARHAVLWENGIPTRIGTLGGEFWHTPMAINARGDVVGFSNPPGGDLDGNDLRAFFWTRHGGTTDLGKLEGDGSSQAMGINTQGTMVGVSCGAVCTALVWHEGVRYKLKDLVGGDFPHHLWSARAINDEGQITGRLVEAGTNRLVPFVATLILP